MAAVSKLYQEPVCLLHCSQVAIHPGMTCFQNYLRNYYEYSIGAFKYFLPLLLSPMLFKLKTMNRATFLVMLRKYLETCIYTSTCIAGVFTCSCLFRNYQGRFQKYSFLVLPAMVGMQMCWFFPKHTLNLFVIASSQAVFETLLRQYPNALSRIVLRSKLVQTVLFMLNSAIILHYKRAQKYNGFWFVQTKAPAEENSSEEVDEQNVARSAIFCKAQRARIWETLKPYLIFGFSVDVLQSVMKGQVAKGSSGIGAICLAKIKALRLSMTGFLVSYVSIYRSAQYLLSRYFGKDVTDQQHLISAFLAGASYAFLGKFNIYSFSLIITVRILWQQFCNLPKNEQNPNVLVELLKQAPFGALGLPVGWAYIVHHYFFYGDSSVSGLAKQICDKLTAGGIRRMRNGIKNHSVEFLMQEAGKRAPRGFFS